MKRHTNHLSAVTEGVTVASRCRPKRHTNTIQTNDSLGSTTARHRLSDVSEPSAHESATQQTPQRMTAAQSASGTPREQTHQSTRRSCCMSSRRPGREEHTGSPATGGEPPHGAAARRRRADRSADIVMPASRSETHPIRAPSPQGDGRRLIHPHDTNHNLEHTTTAAAAQSEPMDGGIRRSTACNGRSESGGRHAPRPAVPHRRARQNGPTAQGRPAARRNKRSHKRAPPPPRQEGGSQTLEPGDEHTHTAPGHEARVDAARRQGPPPTPRSEKATLSASPSEGKNKTETTHNHAKPHGARGQGEK